MEELLRNIYTELHEIRLLLGLLVDAEAERRQAEWGDAAAVSAGYIELARTAGRWHLVAGGGDDAGPEHTI